ncbi:hypothetical protein QYE76_026744 [Lolium multiflorum]|uniref:CCHC-type domain-containing protein n=1 Tax=Lolium multiflorum TaxID=4521 RepID=A0AAD8VVH9_LOLMU|nr:hypothetical protein QYE76_026744 [Lolium multiflorum]
MERRGESERAGAAAGKATVGEANPSRTRGTPSSPESVSSARPVVSGLGLSSCSSGLSPAEASSSLNLQATGTVQAQGRRIQDRLQWVQPKPSRKAAWRRRKSLRRQQQASLEAPRAVSPSMAGRCFKCLRPGHPKRACWNEQVCYRCGEEGHGSGGCKRPRSPDSEDDLRQKALALVDRRLAERRGNTQPGTRGQGAPAAWQPGAPGRREPAGRGAPPTVPPAQPSPPGSAGSWAEVAAPRPGMGVSASPPPSAWPPCIVRRSTAMEDMETRLECSLVAYVGGSRPAVSREQVADALALRAGIPRAAFTVHRFRPEDFLIVFAAPEFKESVMRRPSLPFAFFTLYFRQWTRQAQARRVVMKTRVSLAVEGIPAHAWEKEVVQQLVGASCSLDVLAPETASRTDLGTFRAEAWTTDPDGIPPVRELWVPEPKLGEALAGGSRQPRPARRDTELGLLQYNVLIHVSRVEEFVRIDAPDADPRSAPGSGRNGRMDQDRSGAGEEGFWTSRSLPWLHGVPDRRNDHSGEGRGRTATESQWQLPHLEPLDSTVQRIPAASVPIPEVDCVGPTVQREEASGVPVLLAAADPEAHPDRAYMSGVQPILLGGLGIGAPEAVGLEDDLDQFKSREVESNLRAGTDGDKSGENTREGSDCDLTKKDGSEVAATDGVSLSGSSATPVRASVGRGGEVDGPVLELVETWRDAEYFEVSITGGQSWPLPQPATAAAAQSERRESLAFSEDVSVEPLISFHGPDEAMQGRIMDRATRENMSVQEEAALGKMRRFCAMILKKLAPPLLREIESSNVLRREVDAITPRRVTRATATAPITPAPRKPKKVSAAETVLLRALGITDAELDVSEEAIAEFRELFDSPVRDQHLRAMAAIFGKTMPERFDERTAQAGAVMVQ